MGFSQFLVGAPPKIWLFPKTEQELDRHDKVISDIPALARLAPGILSATDYGS